MWHHKPYPACMQGIVATVEGREIAVGNSRLLLARGITLNQNQIVADASWQSQGVRSSCLRVHTSLLYIAPCCVHIHAAAMARYAAPDTVASLGSMITSVPHIMFALPSHHQ